MKLYVQTPKHGTLHVEAKESDTIEDVTLKIYEKTGEGWPHYCLFYNTRLPGNHTVSQCGLCDGFVVKWRRMKGIIVVTNCKDLKRLWVWNDAVVQEVKAMIEEESGIPVAHQTLKYGGVELGDGCTMQACGVLDDGSDCKLQLVTSEPPSLQAHAPTRQPVSTPTSTPTRSHTSTPTSAPTRPPRSAPTSTPTRPPTSTPSVRHKKSDTVQSHAQQRPTSTCSVRYKEKYSQLTTKYNDLEQRVATMESIVRQNTQEHSQTDDELLASRVARLETAVASWQRPSPSETSQKQNTSSDIQQKFKKNFKAFFDVDLEVADYLFSDSVLSRDTYDFIFDRNTPQSRAERVREMLREVMKSENNIRAFHQALLDHGTSRSNELAALLQ